MQITKELVEANWPLTCVEIGEPIKLVQGAQRTVGIAHAKEGKFTYKIASPWKTKKAIENDLKVFDFLSESKFSHITRLLKTKAGTNYVQAGDNLICLLEYVEGEHPEETPETYSRLGEIMAELHGVVGCPQDTEFLAASVIEHNLPDIAKRLPFGKAYLELVKQQPDYSRFSKTLIHTDIGPGNSIKRPDGEIILIDWDDAGVGTTILDLGYPLIQQFVSQDLELKADNARAFYGAYFSKRDLPDSEKRHIFDAAIFFSLMYIIYGDVEKRWKRIEWAVQNKAKLEALLGYNTV